MLAPTSRRRPAAPALPLLTLALGAGLLAQTAVARAQEGRGHGGGGDGEPPPSVNDPTKEAKYLREIRAVTTDGRNGEAYFSPDGKKLIFQSIRGEHPHYQIYTINVDGSGLKLISTGKGKTTCSFFRPDGKKVIFASTHLAEGDGTDERTGGGHKPEDAEKKGEGGEGDGKRKGYRWDFDRGMDVFVANPDGSDLTRLTDTDGYDAESSYSPDGKKICFTSARSGDLEIWVMNADGTEPKQLTSAAGYDGGPFFSPDGQRICFRGFRGGPDNHRDAQLYTIKADGTDEQKITDEPGTVNWGPFYHPGGRWLVYSSNRADPQRRNFELFLIRPEGGEPIRITWNDGFDALPTFSRDGKWITWTSSREGKAPQNYIAKFRDPDDSDESSLGHPRGRRERLMEHVRVLSSDELEGRKAGTAGGRAAARYIGAQMLALGLVTRNGEPARTAADFAQPFEIASGVKAGPDNVLSLAVADSKPLALTAFTDFTPLPFSASGEAAGNLVFCGYGISSEPLGYDDYRGVDVNGKIAVIFRHEPQAKNPHSPFNGDQLSLHADLRYKAAVARDKGAVAVIVVNDPLNVADEEDALLPLASRPGLGDAGIPVVNVKRASVEKLFAAAGLSLEQTQRRIDERLEPASRPIAARVRLRTDLSLTREPAQNVIGLLRGSDPALADETIVIGAHYDHLGHGGPGSLADAPGEVHNGADDNASGTAALLEVARDLVERARAGHGLRRTVVFCAFDAEEMGLLGSAHYVKNPPLPLAKTVFMLNMDMVGRLGDRALTVGGAGTAKQWPQVLERANQTDPGLKLALKDDGYGPSDHSSFYAKGVPVIFLFTGAHSEYHKPSDDWPLIDEVGLARVQKLATNIIREVDALDAAPEVVAAKDPAAAHGHGEGVPKGRGGGGAYLGTIPDYGQEEGENGVLLTGVRPGSPAEQGGLRGGDRVVELGGKKIGNLYDYTYALRALKPGDEVKMVVLREGEEKSLQVTIGRRGE